MAKPIPFSELFADRPGCDDPIECGHEAALGQAQEEVARLRAALEEVAFRSVQRDLAHLARTALDSRPSTTEEGEA